MSWFKSKEVELVEAEAEYSEIIKQCQWSASRSLWQEERLSKLAVKIAGLKYEQELRKPK